MVVMGRESYWHSRGPGRDLLLDQTLLSVDRFTMDLTTQLQNCPIADRSPQRINFVGRRHSDIPHDETEENLSWQITSTL